MPITASTRASITCGNWREKIDTAKVQPPRIMAHSSNEPSWAPHTALNLKYQGKALLELLAT
ncbi:hypothetical protein D3C77_216020 [compost metagenome]